MKPPRETTYIQDEDVKTKFQEQQKCFKSEINHTTIRSYSYTFNILWQ